jgi:hypothetical protein
MCPFEWVDGVRKHVWRPKVSIYPIKQLYDINDTITIVYTVTDSLYDHNAQADFYVPEHPFVPLCTLLKVEGSTTADGFLENHLLVDSLYNPIAVRQTQGHFTIDFDYQRIKAEDNFRTVMFRLCLLTPGVYLMTNSDAADFADELQVPELFEYDFPCKSYTNRRSVFPTLQHEDFLDGYDYELERILDQVYGGNYKTSRSLEGMKIALRREAAFAFEVR